MDAILTSWKEEKENMKLAHDKTLDSLEYNIARTKVFEKLAELFYHSSYDDIDGVKKMYDIVRKEYPVGAYYPPCKKDE